MPVEVTDIQARYSGGAGNTDPNASLGGVMSSTAWTASATHDLFDQITLAEDTARDIEYRCIYIRNNHATDTATNLSVYLTWHDTDGGIDLKLGLDPAGVGNGTTTGVATTIANEGTAPTGVTFRYADKTDRVDDKELWIGDLAAGQAFAVWLWRKATGGGAQAAGGQMIRVGFE